MTYGACGHRPIQLDLTSWNTLIKVCCYRGAIFRALEILNQTMPQNNIEPDKYSYNTIMEALARVVSCCLIVLDACLTDLGQFCYITVIADVHIFFSLKSIVKTYRETNMP